MAREANQIGVTFRTRVDGRTCEQVLVNNRAEENAPLTVQALVDRLQQAG